MMRSSRPAAIKLFRCFPAAGALLLLAAAPLFPVLAEPRVDRRVVLDRVESEETAFRVVQEVAGLQNPWAIEFLPDDRMLVTERGGLLWLIDGDDVREVAGVPEVHANGQGGLLDVIAHPNFIDNQVIYISYAAEYSGGAGTRVARARLEDRELKDLKVILQMNVPNNKRQHFGSRFAFDHAGYLYVTLGDRGEREYAQRLDDLRGSVVRLHDDGRVPDTNPFVGRDGARPEIFSYGHRNSQGLLFDPVSGLLWSHEHGPRGGDNLHIITPGVNYGWPLATYGREYYGPKIGTTPDRLEDVQNPIVHWTPSIAPCGLTQLRGGNTPEWEGNLFAGALVKQHIRRIVLDGKTVVHQEELLKDQLGRIREIVVGNDGNIWFATDARPGGIYRIEPLPLSGNAD